MQKKAIVIHPPFLEPHRPPISCAIIAEVFRLNNFDVTAIDLNIELFHELGSDKYYDCQNNHSIMQETEIQKDAINKIFSLYLTPDAFADIDFVAISCFSYWNIRMTEDICRHIRSICQSKIIIGGPGLEYKQAGQRIYDQKLTDYYVVGEGEIALDSIIKGLDNIAGVNGNPPEQINDIENLPLPNYGFFDLNKYDWLLDAPDVLIYGSRGCVRKCTFCDIEHYWPKFRYRSGVSIAEEMISNYERFGVRYFYFADSLVNGTLKEFEKFSERLASYKENFFRWAGYAIVRPRGQHSANHFDVVKASGAWQWAVGIESGVDRIRFEMKKKFTNDDIDWHLEQCQRIGLRNLFLMIPTWHTETLEEHNQYLEVFPRWKHFAVDGTILGLGLTSTVDMMPTAPVGKLEGKEYFFDPIISTDNLKLRGMSWLNPRNPGLTHKEKFRRTLAVYDTAIQNQWPLHDRVAKLMELKSNMQGIASKLRAK